MSDWYSDVYSSPEKHGLEIVGTVHWDDEEYQFDMTVVWRDKEHGTLYWADDSGCSCPAPFEEYMSREQLDTGAFWDLTLHLEDRLQKLVASEYRKSYASSAQDQIVDLLWKVRSL